MIDVCDRQYHFLQDNEDKRFVVMYGGSSSGKSHTVAQYLLIEKFWKIPHIGILVVRKTRPAVKTSCWKLMLDWLEKMGYPVKVNNSELLIKNRIGSFIILDGLDDVAKKKSIEGINYIWIEEAAGIRSDSMITEHDYLLLDIICRAKQKEGRINQIFLSFNPVDPIGNEWLVNKTEGRDADVEETAILKVNHKDNRFLSEHEHRRIESLINTDVEYDKIYRLGEWATPSHIIYTNWDIVDDWPQRYDERLWGLDFGYSSNPAALVELRRVGKDEVYECERLYRTGLTNPQLIRILDDIIPKNEMVIADSAEPKSIQEIRNAGFMIQGCKKGADSVRFGIQAVRSFKTHIIAGSENMVKEKRGYKWKPDAQDKPTKVPLKYLDHLMDAERYAIMKIRTKIKAGLSLVGFEKQEPVEEASILGDDGWSSF